VHHLLCCLHVRPANQPTITVPTLLQNTLNTPDLNIPKKICWRVKLMHIFIFSVSSFTFCRIGTSILSGSLILYNQIHVYMPIENSEWFMIIFRWFVIRNKTNICIKIYVNLLYYKQHRLTHVLVTYAMYPAKNTSLKMATMTGWNMQDATLFIIK